MFKQAISESSILTAVVSALFATAFTLFVVAALVSSPTSSIQHPASHAHRQTAMLF